MQAVIRFCRRQEWKIFNRNTSGEKDGEYTYIGKRSSRRKRIRKEKRIWEGQQLEEVNKFKYFRNKSIYWFEMLNKEKKFKFLGFMFHNLIGWSVEQ